MYKLCYFKCIVVYADAEFQSSEKTLAHTNNLICIVFLQKYALKTNRDTTLAHLLTPVSELTQKFLLTLAHPST